jgi:hypothetical protein
MARESHGEQGIGLPFHLNTASTDMDPPSPYRTPLARTAVLHDDLCGLGLVVRQLGNGPGSSGPTACVTGKGC